MANELLHAILEKLDRLSDDISDIKVVQGRQEENLGEHMRRTELAEENLELLRGEIKPIKSYVEHANGVFKFFGGLAILATLISGILKIVQHI